VKTGIFVLGMHRSGTSAATRLVNLLGVPTCVVDDLMPETQDNPRGYWESSTLGRFNDRVLDELGCDWSCPPALEPGWEEGSGLEALRAEAAGVHGSVFPTDEWVWKDPRNTVLLPFWLRTLGVRPLAIFVHRNPLEVAASLGRRDGFGKALSLALWERYARIGLRSLVGVPTLVTRFADLLDDPVAWSLTAAEFLRAEGVSVGVRSGDEARGFVDKSLRHAEGTTHDLERDPDVSVPQLELFRALESLAGTHPALSVPALVRETVSTERLLAERRLGRAGVSV
jgi:hypothetical protein